VPIIKPAYRHAVGQRVWYFTPSGKLQVGTVVSHWHDTHTNTHITWPLYGVRPDGADQPVVQLHDGELHSLTRFYFEEDPSAPEYAWPVRPAGALVEAVCDASKEVQWRAVPTLADGRVRADRPAPHAGVWCGELYGVVVAAVPGAGALVSLNDGAGLAAHGLIVAE
jgi:hypothetical protein